MVIAPSITANDPHEYRTQLENVAPFATRVHIDFMDGNFTPTVSPALQQAWWPESAQADLHLMDKAPLEKLDIAISLKPRLVVVHAEASGNFVEMARKLHERGIKAGVALLQKTKPDAIKAGLEHIDHVLIFSGKLGYFGGTADLKLLNKVKKLKKWKASLEIGWDGGIDDSNIGRLIEGGVDVLNVGGFIQKSPSPANAYATLYRIANKIKT